MEPVIDPNGRVKDFADAAAFWNWRSEPGEVLEKLNVVEKGRTEPFGGRRAIVADVVENDLQIN